MIDALLRRIWNYTPSSNQLFIYNAKRLTMHALFTPLPPPG